MDISKIINEEIGKALFKNMVWFHGTPDNREVRKTNSFSSKTNTIDYISEPEKWQEMQNQMQDARNNGDDELYFNLLDQVSKFRKSLTYKRPIYFTSVNSVAKTYADPHRAFDYQGANPSVFHVEIDDSGNKLTVSAHGERFRGISVDSVRQALLDAGVSNDEINNKFAMFPVDIRNNEMSSEMLGVIAQLLGFDIIDVIGVLDSYHGGNTKSTVRMVFDPSRVRIIN